MIQRGTHDSGAAFSEDDRYRYLLWRRWADRAPLVFIMLNPSTANEYKLDPTVTRCVRMAKTLGFGGCVVANIFALRSTNPRALYTVSPDEAIGPSNDEVLRQLTGHPTLIVAAWGVHGDLYGRQARVLELLQHTDVYALGSTKGGHPRHPLYLSRDRRPTLWRAGLPPEVVHRDAERAQEINVRQETATT